jgi:putative flippase GtrA
VRRFLSRLYSGIVRYAVKFGIVGLIGYGIDVGIFNALRLAAPLDPDDALWYQGPLGAKLVSVTVSTLVTWFGNRYWTFRENRRRNFVMELLEFTVIAVLGLGISLLCLWVSHYVLGYRTLLADNISGNVIGLVLATAFRFLMYRFWVYGPQRKHHQTVAGDRVATTQLQLPADEAQTTRIES